jgi:hypothetical protein
LVIVGVTEVEVLVVSVNEVVDGVKLSIAPVA